METIEELFEEWVKAGKPKQSPSAWISRKDSWVNNFPNLGPFVSKLPIDLDRDALREIANQENFHAIEKFIATMIWGYGDRGYGSYRVLKILSQENSEKTISHAHDLCRSSDPISAYEYFQANPIRGLGPSFGTKFISFMTPIEVSAPILDSLVARWLVEFGPSDFWKTERHFSRWNLAIYVDYVNYISDLSVKLKCHAETIEQLIFDSATSKFSVGDAWLLGTKRQNKPD